MIRIRRIESAPKQHRVGDVANSIATVHCMRCYNKKRIDTVVALKSDTWPMCCGQYMEEAQTIVRRRIKKSS